MTNDARSVFALRRQGRLQAGHGAGLGDLAIAEGAQHLQHLAPGRERPAVVALVLVHRLHEDDFLVVVVPFAGGRVDLPAALALLPAVLTAAALDGHGNAAFAAVSATTVRALAA